MQYYKEIVIYLDLIKDILELLFLNCWSLEFNVFIIDHCTQVVKEKRKREYAHGFIHSFYNSQNSYC